jgi:hypothetical protein
LTILLEELGFIKKKPDPRLVAWWYHLGELYGYPVCCIEAFVYRISNQISDNKKGYIVHKDLDATGFIPCEHCSKKPVTELLDYINLHRKENSVFPKELPLNDFKYYHNYI